MATSALNIVTIEDLKMRLEDLVERAHGGEEWVIISAEGVPVAKLAAAPLMEADVSPVLQHPSLLGLMEGQIRFLPGWDDPVEEFEPYS